MKCGDKGHTTATGAPCGQTIAATAAGCVWHTRDAEGRRLLATRGALASRMQHYLPSSAPRPEFSSTAAIVTWAEQTAHKVLAGELDPRAAGEARQLAALTIAARSADATQQLVEALVRLEGGGQALVLLGRLREGLDSGARKPLPGRVLAMTTTPSPEPA
jgi:hypothetical protein